MKVRETGEVVEVDLKVPGLRNVANALAALSAATACGVALASAAAHIREFSGIRRRLEVVGTANEITVVDDFAHNPDKISATARNFARVPRPFTADVSAARLRSNSFDEGWLCELFCKRVTR